jgi:small subunit ribosomal protein S17
MRTKIGTITSAKMTGTVTVTIHSSVLHPLYKKRFRASRKFLADINGMKDLREGDMVQITECRPLSKNKHFKVTEIIKQAPRVSEMADEKDIAAVTKTKADTDDSPSTPSA